MRDVCTGSGARLRDPLGPWWGCWLAAMWLTNQAAFSSAGFGSRDPSMIPFFELLATPVTIVAFVMWVRIVRSVTEAQKGSRGDSRLTP